MTDRADSAQNPIAATPPGFGETFRLTACLRFKLLWRRLGRRSLSGTLLATLLACFLSCGLGVGSYLLFAGVEIFHQNSTWLTFTLSLYWFLLSLFWVIWPVIAAQVDEAYELGRFLHFPVSPRRMYLIQSGAALVEPSVLFFYPALIGAAGGLGATLQPDPVSTVILLVAFTLMNVAAGRFLQNLFLNLMTSRRSGEILFGAFLGVLALAAFIPPVDASWLFARFGSFGQNAADLRVLRQATRSLAYTPPGLLTSGLWAAAHKRPQMVAATATGMLAIGTLAWFGGLILLKRFYHGGRSKVRWPLRAVFRTQRRAHNTRRGCGWRLPWISDPVAAVFEQQLKSLLKNPKARLLFAVPFFLLILLKIISAPELFRYLWSDRWAAVLLTLLGVYVLSVLSGQFFGNGFGYDGAGVKQVFLTPVSVRTWIYGRNLAQFLLAAVQFAGLWLLLFFSAPKAARCCLALPLTSFLFGLTTMLASGNLLSARYPRRFHYTLARRDRPVPASFVWILVTLGAGALMVLALMTVAARTGLPLWIALAGLPVLGVFCYGLTLPVAARWTMARKEHIIESISHSG